MRSPGRSLHVLCGCISKTGSMTTQNIIGNRPVTNLDCLKHPEPIPEFIQRAAQTFLDFLIKRNIFNASSMGYDNSASSLKTDQA